VDPIRDLQNQYPLGLPVGESKDSKVKKSDKKGLSRSFRKSLDQAANSQEFERLDLKPEEIEEALESLLDNVHDTGDRLTKNPSHALLQEYKKAIKDFLQVVVSSAFEVAQKEGRLKKDFKRNKYTQINLINARLDKLAASVLQGQAGALSLLAKVEELNGLLVDLVR
jgi:uncharacterized protein YaaR (DUF327 family)